MRLIVVPRQRNPSISQTSLIRCMCWRNVGVKITGVYIVILNREYVLEGELEIEKLFTITDVTEQARREQVTVESNLEMAAELLTSDQEPEIPMAKNCKSPYNCPFLAYCTSELPSEEAENRRADSTDKENIRRFIYQLCYPLYFLDFETLQPVIPKYQGTRPYDQIPFQYSLHYKEFANGELQHREFLAEPGTDPRRAIAERLCADIPNWACITAYNKAFECTRIKELGGAIP